MSSGFECLWENTEKYINFFVSINKNITENDYKHLKHVCNMFHIKNLGNNHDLYVQSGTVLVVDIFENFWDTCVKTCNLNSFIFILHLPYPELQPCK